MVTQSQVTPTSKGAAQEERSNPAAPTKEPQRPPRVPMNQVRRKLEARPIPGYHCHYFKEENVGAALEAYYEFVRRDEVRLNPIAGIGSDSNGDGNTDLGTNVSIVAGKSESGMPVRLILMKIKDEYHNQDLENQMRTNGFIMESIFGEEAQFSPEQYRKIGEGTSKALFNRSKRVAKIGKRGR